MEQIGLPGSDNLLKQQLAVSGLEMTIWPVIGAVVGAGLSMWGASKAESSKNEQTKIQHAMDKDNWKYQNEAQEANITFTREQNEITRWNNLNNALFRDQTALQNWQLQIDQQLFEHGTNLAAKAQADKQLESQLEMNKAATELAKGQQENWMRDRNIERDFAIQDQNIIMAKANNDMESAFNEILMNRTQEAVSLEGQVAGIQHKAQYERGMKAFQKQESIVNGLVAAGKAQNMQAGRSTDKAIQSAMAGAGREQTRLDYEATNIFKLASISIVGLQQDLIMNNLQAERLRDEVSKDYISKAQKYDLDKQSINASYDSAARANEFQQTAIRNQKQQADFNAWGKHFMADPQMGPQPPPPFSTPLPVILDPQDHVWSPKPRKGAMASGGVLAAAGSALPGIVSAGIEVWG